MSAKLKITLSMLIFSTIGLFRRWVDLPSGLIAMLRGAIGMLFLLLVLRISKQKMDKQTIRRKLLPLCLSGAAMGFNWILLFEAYNYTSVATATLCYYFAPMFIILASAVVFRERITLRKGVCVAVALVGMVCISGVLQSGFAGLRGILLSLGAAVLYASVVMLNKATGGVSGYDRTIVQLAASSVVLLPYVLLAEGLPAARPTPVTIALMLVVGILHTGVAYALYFGSLKDLSAQTAAILSYIDPVGAVLLSALLLREHMDALGVVGAILVIGAAVASELPEHKKL